MSHPIPGQETCVNLNGNCSEVKCVCEEEVEIKSNCEKCGGDGYIEIMGDGEGFEYDVVGHKPCPECQNND